MEWTNKQRDAIEARDGSLLISAAAGSGKTAVMVQRILSLVLGGADLSHMLVVTFTRAAAGSMRRKIASALAQELAADPENAHLQHQQESLLRAQISTYDAFCAAVVRRYYYLLDCPPDFSVTDQAQEMLLQHETALEILEEAASEAETGTLSGLDELYTALLKGKQDTAVIDAILNLYRYLCVFPDPLAQLDALAAQYDLPPGQTVFYGFLLSRVRLLAAQAEEYLCFCRELTKTMENGAAYEALVQADLALLQTFRNGSPDQMGKPEFSRIPTGKARCVQAWLHEEFKDLRDTAKNIVNKKLLPLAAALQDGDAGESLCLTGRNLRLLCELTRRFDARLLAKKHEKGRYSFSDIARFAVQVLSDPAAAAEIRDGFDYLFVDEYQDSNRVQEFLLETLSRGNNLFLVGDVKQSIYRFRQADPSLFVQRMNRFSPPVGRRIDLNHNFRSHSGVLDAVNLIFSQLMHAETFEVEYDDDARLRPGEGTWQTAFVPQSPCAELCLLKAPPQKEAPEDDLLAEYADEEAELLMLCGRIRELLQEEIFDPALGHTRFVRPGDIVILDQKARSRAHHYQKIFREQELPLVYDPAGGYLESMEVGIMLDLLTLLTTSRADEALLAVLFSPIGGFEADELAQMRAAHRKGAFHEAFAAWAKGPSGAKAAAFLQRLEQWRLLGAAMQIEQFLWLLYEQTGFYAYVSALPGGAVRCRNLALLASDARQYAEREGAGIPGFLRYLTALSRLENAGMDSGAPHESQDAVQLMTIHKSKGLEFPVCVLSMTGHQLKGLGSGVLPTNDTLGACVPFRRLMPDGTVQTRKTQADLAIAVKNAEEDRAEWLRLLYVAMTRAVNKLILTGMEKKPSPDRARLSRYGAANADCFLDWLIPVLARHRDGAALRALYGIHPETVLTEGRWRIRVTEPTELRHNRTNLEETRSRLQALLNGDFPPEALAEAARLRERYAYRYPFAEAVSVRSKQGVTELTHERVAPPRAQWQTAEERETAGTERGNAYHTVLEHLDFTLKTPLLTQLDALTQRRLLTPQQHALLDPEKLTALLNTPLAARMARAELHREVPFTLTREQNGETVLVQGIVDCYFRENGKIVLVDYKSDRARGRREELCARYAPQLALYRRALEQILKTEVSETLLVLLDTAEIISLPR